MNLGFLLLSNYKKSHIRGKSYLNKIFSLNKLGFGYYECRSSLKQIYFRERDIERAGHLSKIKCYGESRVIVSRGGLEKRICFHKEQEELRGAIMQNG